MPPRQICINIPPSHTLTYLCLQNPNYTFEAPIPIFQLMKLEEMAKKISTSGKSVCSGFHFPLELLIEVLARLPAKTLLKFRCVCKEWRSLIECPNFASLHLNLCKNNRENSHLFLVESTNNTRETVFSSIRCSSTLQRTCQIGLPDCFRNGWVGGYMNGLLLGRHDNAKEHTISNFVVWNPSIRKSIEITHPTLLLSNASTWVGLGYDAMANDYKLVLIVPPWKSWILRTQFQVSVHVYSIGGRSWKSRTVDTQFLMRSMYTDAAIFLNGAIHWMGYDVTVVPYHDNYVIAFDVQSEVFNYFRLPDRGSDNRHYYQRLAALGELLALLEYNHYKKSIVVWVMKQYGEAESWVKRVTINLDFEGVHLRRNGEILFTMANQRVKAYNFETAEIKDLGRSMPMDKVIFIDDEVESLMLLTQRDKGLKGS